MSDPFLTEFWRTAPPPWNTLGPEMAAGVRRTIRRNFATNQTHCNQWARALRRARKSRGMSQEQVSAALGFTSSSSISHAELNQAAPDAVIWAKLAAFYGITLE